jgi:hypothetical protein
MPSYQAACDTLQNSDLHDWSPTGNRWPTHGNGMGAFTPSLHDDMNECIRCCSVAVPVLVCCESASASAPTVSGQSELGRQTSQRLLQLVKACADKVAQRWRSKTRRRPWPAPCQHVRSPTAVRAKRAAGGVAPNRILSRTHAYVCARLSSESCWWIGGSWELLPAGAGRERPTDRPLVFPRPRAGRETKAEESYPQIYPGHVA